MTEPVTAIYHPPRKGLPYLVVTLSQGQFNAVPARTLAEARSLAHRASRVAQRQAVHPRHETDA